MQLSEHFALEQLTASQEATRRGIDNSPGPAALQSLTRLAAMLEEVQVLLRGTPLHVTSGYRCEALNRCIGGSPRSAHMEGRAVDFIAPGFGTPYQVALRLSDSPLAFHQLIFEFGRWVHLAIPPAGEPPRREVLSIFKPGSYLAGLIQAPSSLA